MKKLKHLLDANRAWAGGHQQNDADFFRLLAEGQQPSYLWIGCSDSRVPPNQIVNLEPGEIFVHRNIANVVKLDDPNAMSVIQYAVQQLKVAHVIVCGHYGCGGVQAALDGVILNGPIDDWLQAIKDVAKLHAEELADTEPSSRADRLSELNVLAQVKQICDTNIVREAWDQGQNLLVHSWIYTMQDGIIKPLQNSISGVDQLP